MATSNTVSVKDVHRLFHRRLVSVELHCPSGWSVSVLLLDNLHMAFRKVPIGTLRNETVSGRKCLALRRRQGLVDCFVRIEVLCGFIVGLVRLFHRSIISRFAKYQLVLCETRRFPVGNALLGEGGSLSSIVSSAVTFCVALLSV